MGKFNVGDFVEIADKKLDEYSYLVVSELFVALLMGQKLMVRRVDRKNNDYLLRDKNGGILWLNENDIKAWEE